MNCRSLFVVSALCALASTAAAECPEGARARGGAPPFGVEQWCVDDAGLRQGTYQRWFVNGAKREAGTYADGKKHGDWTYWHGNGALAAKVTFHFGRRHGPFATWKKDGSKKREGQFVLDRPHGLWTYYEDGVVAKKRFQLGDVVKARAMTVTCPAGTERRGDAPPAGTLQFCVNAANQKSGPWVLWHQNGEVAETRTYLDDQLMGVVERYGKEGYLLERTAYRRGQKHGESRRYSDSGVLSEVRHFVKGKPEGVFVEYDDNGQKLREGEYKDGKRHGIWQQWSRSGKLLGTLILVNGTGTWKAWYDNGELREEGELKDDKREGRWRTFKPDGWVQTETWYRAGRAVPAP